MDAIYKFLMLIFCVAFTKAQQNPTISFITKEKVASIGDTMSISCSVQYAKNYPVIWAKIDPNNLGNILFISKGASLSIPDNRYSVRHDDASSTYTLQISKIQEIDAGIYQCQVVISFSSRVTANVNVYVRTPPVISDNSTRSMITSTGEAIQLECYASGYPQPSISWRRENDDLLLTGGSLYMGNILMINNITKADRGTYYCKADNGVGSGAQRNVLVEVEFAPGVYLERTFYKQALGQDIKLQCHVESYPQATIRWLKDGIEIQNSQHHHISTYSTSHDYTDSVLHIQKLESRHFGEYVCRATNKLGSHQQVVELLQSSDPTCPPFCNESYFWFEFGSSAATRTSVHLTSLSTLVITLVFFFALSL